MRACIGASVLFALIVGLGCGSGPSPREQDIWYTPSLRPGQVPPTTAGERELLARLGQLPSGQAVSLEGQVFVPGEPYQAASGRTCRPIGVGEPDAEHEGDRRLACEDRQHWVFVPDVFADPP